ncbi:MAG: GDSL-type esterase/lipase family protein [Phycisphaerae bacterium]|nr:GDSL-type esterase/lipase family protein [Phycisphaerae bacterium]
MNMKKTVCAALLLILAGVAQAAITVLPSNPNILYTGRVDMTTPDVPVLGWPGTSIIANFQGTSLTATFKTTQYAFIYVMIDGGAPTQFNMTNSKTTYTLTLASGLSNTVHKVEIVKKSEGNDGYLKFQGFGLDSGKTLVAPPARPSLKLEFYGDSGAAGNQADSAMTSNSMYNDNYYAFPGIVSRMLGAEYQCMGYSGIGIASGYAPVTMRTAYNRTLPLINTPAWDFNNYTPDAVVILLGANDVSNGSTQAQIMAGWEAFVTSDLRPHYPNAHICFVDSYGWNYNESANYTYQSVANLHAAGDLNVSYVLVPWLWGMQEAVICEQAGFANIIAPHLATELGLSAPTPSPLSCFSDPGQVINGGFETVSITEPTTEVAGWRNGKSGGGACSILTSGAHSGTKCIKASIGTRSGYAFFSHSAEATPGQTYTATAFMKATAGTTGKLRLEFRDQQQNSLLDVQGAKTVTGNWAQYSTTGTAPAGTWHVRVVCMVDTKGNAILYDDVVLTQP